MDDAPPPPAPLDPRASGRLTRAAAIELLDRGSALLASGDFAEAGALFSRVVGFDDPAITAAALLGLGEAHYRLDDENAAVQSWSAVLQLPETPSTYTAWRNIAAARVRDGDLVRAIDAYREADRRAPAADKAEISTRLGWLTKETGNTRAASGYFARGRGDGRRLTLTLLIIAITSIISLTALFSSEGDSIIRALILDKQAIANGEYWRLWSVTLLHADLLHLAFNMYALYLAGTVIERWYGWLRYAIFYLACAAAGSTASFVFSGGNLAVGASGAIFGLFGILFAAGRIHHPVDRESRGLMGQIGFLVLINIAFGFASGGAIDNAAHLGGLAAGLWLGALLPPNGVPTLSSLWRRPAPDGRPGTPGTTGTPRSLGTSGIPAIPGPLGTRAAAATGTTTAPGYLIVLGIAVIAVAVVAGVAVGTSARTGSAGDRVPVALVAAAQDRSGS